MKSIVEDKALSPMLLKRSDVERMTGLSRSTIYRMMDADKFPRPIKLSETCARWHAADLDLWLERVVAQAR
jgi:prophage regulatory protein